MAMSSAEEFLRTAAERLNAVEKARRRGGSDIQRFYRGAVVLVTGGAGFLGKQLVEKLLRTCDVKKLYLLLRCRGDTTAEQRLEEMLANPVFESVRAVHPGFAEKIQVVVGDVTQTRLDLAEDAWSDLTETVTVVFHCAASIRFMEPLWKATQTNVKGTIEVLNFGKACKNLQAFVHVSTAYSQALISRHLAELPEQFSVSPVPPGILVEMAANVPDNPDCLSTQSEEIKSNNQRALDDLFNKYIGKEYPNTYAFTKAVSEAAVQTMSADLPLCVIRPTIVIPSYTEPTPGWVDESNVFGASGFILNLVYGVTHVIIADPNVKVDIVPVDLVSNVVLAAGWDTARRGGQAEPTIYSVGSSHRNHITWGTLFNTLFTEVRPHVSPSAVWYAFALQTRSSRLHAALAWLLHAAPASLADTALMLVGKQPRILKTYKIVDTMSKIFKYFLLHSWVFRDDNLQQMYRRMSPTDRQLFNVDIASVDMKELVVLWNIGIRKYILRDGLGGEALAKKRQFLFKIATFMIAPVYFYILYKLLSFVICIFYI